jgi:iron(III) transport system ATP-binding protein
MGEIVLESLGKKFGNVTAVENVDLHIKNGEIISILGPSGCGKTTILRLIAGLETPSTGKIYIDGEPVSSPTGIKPPEKRNLGMVFQNYAIWPHMNVFQNVAYPLKYKEVEKKVQQDRVRQTLSLVGMEGMEKRYPKELSGGQQQRVALARALIMEPTAMLLDEPLSNLDAKLRERMRFEIMELHRKLRLTVVYVTHDQSEAMVLSDRIILMQNKRIAQIGTATGIYREPLSQFVADFVGAANFIESRLVKIEGKNGTVQLEQTEVPVVLPCVVPEPENVPAGTSGLFFVRPEDINLTPPQDSEIVGTVSLSTFFGDFIDYRIDVFGRDLQVKMGPDTDFADGDHVGVVINRGVFIQS